MDKIFLFALLFLLESDIKIEFTFAWSDGMISGASKLEIAPYFSHLAKLDVLAAAWDSSDGVRTRTRTPRLDGWKNRIKLNSQAPSADDE